MRMIRLAALFLAICWAIPVGVQAQFDELGEYIGHDPRGYPGEGALPGDICGTCKDPDPSVWGVAFRDGEMWLMSVRRTLYRMRGCEMVSATLLTGVVLPAGLGYDSRRDLFIVTDASFNVVFRVTPSGRVLGRWATPGPGPVGAAYDSRRDLYWVSDWEEDRLYSIDPKTGLPGPSLEIPAGSRIAGTAYDARLDALVYHGRNEARSYWISAATGELLSTYSIPQRGANNGRGAGIDPTAGDLWLTHTEEPTAFCLRGLGGEEHDPTTRPGREARGPMVADEPAPGPALVGAYPNPFNPVTRIRYVLSDEALVVLSIFDVRGRLVKTLVQDTKPPGEHVVEWQASGMASGVYVCRLTAGGFSTSRRLILLKYKSEYGEPR